MRAPFVRPDAPMPATTRPTISIEDVCAAPQSADPTSKTAKKTRNVHFAARAHASYQHHCLLCGMWPDPARWWVCRLP